MRPEYRRHKQTGVLKTLTDINVAPNPALSLARRNTGVTTSLFVEIRHSRRSVAREARVLLVTGLVTTSAEGWQPMLSGIRRTLLGSQFARLTDARHGA